MVTQEGVASARGVFSRKSEAILDAKVRARKQEPSEVKVHKGDGDMEYENIYGAHRAHTLG